MKYLLLILAILFTQSAFSQVDKPIVCPDQDKDCVIYTNNGGTQQESLRIKSDGNLLLQNNKSINFKDSDETERVVFSMNNSNDVKIENPSSGHIILNDQVEMSSYTYNNVIHESSYTPGTWVTVFDCPSNQCVVELSIVAGKSGSHTWWLGDAMYFATNTVTAFNQRISKNYNTGVTLERQWLAGGVLQVRCTTGTATYLRAHVRSIWNF